MLALAPDHMLSAAELRKLPTTLLSSLVCLYGWLRCIRGCASAELRLQAELSAYRSPGVRLVADVPACAENLKQASGSLPYYLLTSPPTFSCLGFTILLH